METVSFLDTHIEDFRKGLKGFDAPLNELRTVLNHVESNRSRFPHIDDQELNSRKQIYDDLKRVRSSVFATALKHNACNL